MATATSKTRRNGDAPSVEDLTDQELGQLVRSIEIPRIQEHRATIQLRGLSGLISHRFTEKARKMMEDKQQGKASGGREHRNPEQEALDAAYVVLGREDWEDGKSGKYCFPAPAFKHAYLFGVSQLSDRTKFPKSLATGWFFVDEDPILEFDSMSLRSDVGRIGMGTAQHVYRPMFNGWSCALSVTYNTISAEQVVALLDRGGRQGGVGDWRPSAPKNKSGAFGRFCVEGIEEVG